MWKIDQLAGRFDNAGTIDAEGDRKRAAVALILCPSQALGDDTVYDDTVAGALGSGRRPGRGERPSVLVIERASKRGDPWSGHMAFPGGRNDEQDSDLVHTAMRETEEETGIVLARDALAGQLHDIDGRHSNLIVSCFVFKLAQPARMQLNHEVASAFWVGFDHLLDCANLIDYRPPGDKWTSDFPGIRVGVKPNHVIWGLTYRLLCDFVSRLEQVDLPVHIPPQR